MNTNQCLQRRLLEYFAAYAPDFVGGSDFTTQLDAAALQNNLCHLTSQGLIETRFRQAPEGQSVWLCSRITGKGLGLLNDEAQETRPDSNASSRAAQLARHPERREVLTLKRPPRPLPHAGAQTTR